MERETERQTERHMKRRTVHTVVVGSGAAGFAAANRLMQLGVTDVVLVTENKKGGTSRNTGSDKQTYYKLSLAGNEPDSVRELAQALYGGGCVDGDHALCEAALSSRCFYNLVELGIPFPHDQYGAYVGYKTDHDSRERGTSAGPYTSRYMTEALEREAAENHVEILDQHQVIRVLAHGGKLYGILCLNTACGGYVLIRCTNLVYATGGPAGIYADSVYPASQYGASGLAFEAGARGKNLTEWQYGLASLRPRWNVSGSYMQALPRVVSTDQDGKGAREFLLDHYGDLAAMMDMVFMKGYQWPFDAGKAAGGSSMVDLLVYRETCVRGRRVWLDYRGNPGDKPVEWEALSPEARGYLRRSDACGGTPFERLCSLNSPAAAFYKEHGVDLEREMLEVAVCAQHNNGGIAVDGCWQTDVEGIYAVGEAAGTHGICRPGGSALNAGQAGALRAAMAIAAQKEKTRAWTSAEELLMARQAGERIAMGEAALAGGLDVEAAWECASREMSFCGAMLRRPSKIGAMSREIGAELKKLCLAGTCVPPGGLVMECPDRDNPNRGNPDRSNPDREDPGRGGRGREDTSALSWVFRYYDMRLCQKVYLDAMEDYLRQGGRSRGSAVYLEEENGEREGQENRERQYKVPGLAVFSLDGPDGRAHQDVVQEVCYQGPGRPCQASWRPVRKLEDVAKNEAFEVVWKQFRER